jgi:hypothetical protein
MACTSRSVPSTRPLPKPDRRSAKTLKGSMHAHAFDIPAGQPFRKVRDFLWRNTHPMLFDSDDLADTVKEMQASGATSLRAIAAGLEQRGIPAARGGGWSAVQVSRLLDRLGPFGASANAA